MKNYSPLKVLCALALSTVLFSCEKVKDAIKVNYSLTGAEATFYIDAQPAGTQELSQFFVKLNIDSAIKANHSSFGVDNIKSAKIKSVVIEVLNGEGQNTLGALSACHLAFASDNKPTPLTLASLTNNPDVAATSLNIPVDGNQELKDYLRAKSFIYHVSGTTRRPTTKQLQCKAIVTYDLQLGL